MNNKKRLQELARVQAALPTLTPHEGLFLYLEFMYMFHSDKERLNLIACFVGAPYAPDRNPDKTIDTIENILRDALTGKDCVDRIEALFEATMVSLDIAERLAVIRRFMHLKLPFEQRKAGRPADEVYTWAGGQIGNGKALSSLAQLIVQLYPERKFASVLRNLRRLKERGKKRRNGHNSE